MEINQLDALIGVFLPILVAFLSKQSWLPAYKAGIALVFSLLVAVARVALDGKFDINNFVGTLFVVAGAAQVVYVALAKGLNLPVFDWLENTGPIKDQPVPVTIPTTDPDPDNEAGLNDRLR